MFLPLKFMITANIIIIIVIIVIIIIVIIISVIINMLFLLFSMSRLLITIVSPPCMSACQVHN